MIIGMDRALAAARAGQLFIGIARDHFIDVHVGLGAAARLPDDERELIVERARYDGLRGVLDPLHDLRVQAMFRIHPRRRLLHDSLRVDDADRHALGRAERKILDTPLGLRTPIGGGGDFDGPDAVGFGARVGHEAGLPIENKSQNM